MAYHGQLMAMGTRFELVLPAVSQALGETLLSLISIELEQWEQALSIYRTESSARLLNQRLAKTQSAAVDDPLLWQALQFAERGYHLTGGWFNIACGRLYRAYKEDADTDYKAVKIYANARLQLDHRQHRVRVDNAYALLDFGGLGKGLALDQVKIMLLRNGVQSGFLSFGESSILALGQHPNGNYWPVAINHPMYKNQQLQRVPLHNRFLSLSSSVANGANAGNLQAHLVDPKNGRLIESLRTVAVVSESGVMGEIISTAKLVAGDRWSTDALSGKQFDSCQLFHHAIKSSKQDV